VLEDLRERAAGPLPDPPRMAKSLGAAAGIPSETLCMCVRVFIRSIATFGVIFSQNRESPSALTDVGIRSLSPLM